MNTPDMLEHPEHVLYWEHLGHVLWLRAKALAHAVRGVCSLTKEHVRGAPSKEHVLGVPTCLVFVKAVRKRCSKHI